jgi:MFS transporter, PPP family, 3-phenylpropionic acid transporter
MSRKADRVLSLQVAGLQGFYWMIFCPIYSYASVYLLSKDFSNQKIGWVIAISNILAIALQPALGALIDRITKLSLKFVLSALALISLALLAGLILLHTGMFWMGVFYAGIIALLLTMQPLVNALTFEYINAGRNVSFGMTRAMGSISFAVLSTVLGVWVNRVSTAILPIVTLVLFAGFFLLVQTFTQVPRKAAPHPLPKTAEGRSTSVLQPGFLRRYERFIPFLLGATCLFIFHTVINTFLAQIIASVGGHDTDFGVSLTIAAVCELPAFLVFNRLAAKYDNRLLLKISGVFYALRSFIFLFAASVWVINIGQVFQGLSFGIFIPASVYYINQIMHEEDRVKGQTFITGTITLGSFFGSVIGGWLLDLSGVPALLTFGAVGAVLGCLLLIYSVRKPKTVAAATAVVE